MTEAPEQPAEILWRPDPDARPRIRDFQEWVADHGGPATRDYADLWQWSVEEQDAFWLAVWRYFDVPSDAEPTVALADASMPGAVWFPEVRLNYAEAMLRMPGRDDHDTVVVARSQGRDEVRLTATELRDLVGEVRMGLLAAGVETGDRVAAYCPNIPETLAVLLAAASLGAIFSSCAPEFGTQSVTDRWQQIAPKVLVAVDGYRYGAKAIDRRDEVEAIRAALPSVETLVWIPYLDAAAPAPDGAITWDDFTVQPGPLEFTRVPFDHPLYVLFSSGTTGLPKPILHGHGGITVEHLKALALQTDLGPDDTFFWFSTTGWMMWNYLVSGLGVGSTVVMFDGNPAHPDIGMLWRMAAELAVTYFGTSAPFLLQCRKEGLVPREIADLSALRGIGSTGAPLPVEGVFRYRGEVVPVLRLDVLLDLAAERAEPNLYSPLLLVTWQGRPAALLADRVHGDTAVDPAERTPSDPSLSFNGCAAGAFPDRVTGRGGTVTLLDPDRLLSEAEGRLLGAFRAVAERRA